MTMGQEEIQEASNLSGLGLFITNIETRFGYSGQTLAAFIPQRVNSITVSLTAGAVLDRHSLGMLHFHTPDFFSDTYELGLIH